MIYNLYKYNFITNFWSKFYKKDWPLILESNNQITKILTLSSIFLCSYGIINNYIHIYDLAFVVSGMYLADLSTGIIHLLLDNLLLTLDEADIHQRYTKDSILLHAFYPGHYAKDISVFAISFQYELLTSIVFPIYIFSFLFNEIRILKIVVNTFLLFLSLGFTMHAYTHIDNPPTIIRYLQYTGIILSKKQHRIHHHHHLYQKNKILNYCMVNGWADPLLNYLFITFFC